MEQTLGKRIAENRKRMKLTQDQLAEKLGITAQAVSKWENDQSCPDITMLPRLAEIFGVTTDNLLGHQTATTAQPVHEAEVEEDEETDNIHFSFHDDQDQWVFKWFAGRKGSLLLALLVLLVGVLTLLSRINQWDVSFWSILWPSSLLIWGIDRILSKFSFFGLGCTLFGGYFLIENLGVWQISIASDLIFPIIIVLLGISLLVDAMHKPRKPHFQVVHNGNKNKEKTKCSCINGTDGFDCNLSFGENHHQVNLPVLAGGNASVNFGELTVDLRGCESVTGNCYISAHCSFGELILLVPRKYRIEHDSHTAFAAVEVSGHPDPNPTGVIHLDASVNFGEISIQYM